MKNQDLFSSKDKEFKCRLLQTTFINIFHCVSEKIRLNVSSESSAKQRIHMKNQDLFSSKDKNKKFKCRLLQTTFINIFSLFFRENKT